MARRRSSQPTDGELEILKLLWRLGETPLGPLCDALREQREVATTTVATMLGVMLDKGLVTRRRGSRGYVWTAVAREDATARAMLGKLLDTMFDGSPQRLVSHLLADRDLSDEDRREIQSLLADAEKTDDGAPRGRGARKGR